MPGWSELDADKVMCVITADNVIIILPGSRILIFDGRLLSLATDHGRADSGLTFFFFPPPPPLDRGYPRDRRLYRRYLNQAQFGATPDDGPDVVVIEMKKLSKTLRSSAAASKATGFLLIAKIAPLPAVGYTLDEIKNDITRKTPACF